MVVCGRGPPGEGRPNGARGHPPLPHRAPRRRATICIAHMLLGILRCTSRYLTPTEQLPGICQARGYLPNKWPLGRGRGPRY